MPKLFNLNLGGNTPVSGITSAANGLNNNAPHATIVYLGGDLLEATNINLAGFDLTIGTQFFNAIFSDVNGIHFVGTISADSLRSDIALNGNQSYISALEEITADLATIFSRVDPGIAKAVFQVLNQLSGDEKSIIADNDTATGIVVKDTYGDIALIGDAIYSNLFQPKQYAQNNIVPLLLFQGNLATFTTNQAFSFGGVAGILRVSVMVNYSSGAGSVQLFLNYHDSRGNVNNADLGTVDSVNFSLNAASIPILTDGNGANNIDAVVTGTIEYDIAYVIEYFNKQ